MSCAEREPNLLLHGLGELPFWQSWLLSLHVERCGRCRAAQAKLLTASGRMAATLRPAGGPIRAARPAVTVAQGWLGMAALAIVVAGLLILGGIAVGRYGRGPAPAAQQDIPCRPDLPNDKCR
jgi:hypothetical protein